MKLCCHQPILPSGLLFNFDKIHLMNLCEQLAANDYNDLLDKIRYELFGGQWTGVLMINSIDFFNIKWNYFNIDKLGQHFLQHHVKNTFFITIPGKNERKAIFYKEHINQWMKEITDQLFFTHKTPSYEYLPKIKNIKTLNQGRGAFISNDLEVLAGFLFWKIFKEEYFKPEFSRSQQQFKNIEIEAYKKAKILLQKFSSFICVTNAKDSHEHLSFDEIFIELCGDYYSNYFEDENTLLMSGVMK